MTHADVLIRVIAEYGNISTEEAGFIFEEFRHEFSMPEYIGRKLSEKEADDMFNLYRNNEDLLKWVSKAFVQHSRKPLPSA